MVENLNEAMERRAADLETAQNRLNTISEYYKEKSEMLGKVYEAALDNVSGKDRIKTLQDIIGGMTPQKDRLVDLIAKIDVVSKEYVSVMDEIGKVKDMYPEKFDKYGNFTN